MSPRSFVSSLALCLVAASVLTTSSASAQIEPTRYVGSPERFGLELRVGTYTPDFDGDGATRDAFHSFFGNDRGPLIGGEIDIWAYRIPYVGLIGPGLQLGWARYTGRTRDESGAQTDEKAKFTLYPLAALAVLRIDVLARELRVPIVLTPKIGWGYMRHRATPAQGDGRGGSMGLVWGIQLALELDIFEPRAARSLDQEWGINHSYIFFELYGAQTNSAMNTGSDLAWVAGLGLQL